MLGLANSIKQLRHLACKRVSLTTVFYKNSSSSIILLVVYVEDIIITGSDSKCIFIS